MTDNISLPVCYNSRETIDSEHKMDFDFCFISKVGCGIK
jgi:hypothetical protein